MKKLLEWRILTLEPLDSALSKWHGQVERHKVLVVADHSQELKLELVQSLERSVQTSWSRIKKNAANG